MPRRRPFAVAASLTLTTPLLLLAPPAAAAAVAEPYDVNGDGFPELVVGAPGLQVGSVHGAGGISVLPASKQGVSTAGTTVTQATAGVPGDPGPDQQFGAAFASADFDHDGFADLAVGAPELPDPVEGPEYYPNGSVTVFKGGQPRFSTDRSTVLLGRRTGNDYDLAFGSSLAVGDVDGDAKPDLVVGASGLPYDDGEGHPGSVNVCTSGKSGPVGCVPVGGFNTGSTALAIGNVKGDGRDEIVVGQPESSSEGDDGGLVYTLSLSGTGSSLTVKDSELTQASKGVPGSDERNDEFGYAVALGDLDRDGYADLVVGSPGEAIGSRGAAGRVTVVYGGKKGHRTSGNKVYDQNTKGVPGTAESGDGFGAAVSLLDHDADGHLDLTVGAPGENDGAGGVTTLDGSGQGFTVKGAKTFGLGALVYPTLDGAAFGAALGR